MAKDLGDLIVRLAMDSANFDDGLKRLESQMTKVQSQFKYSTTGLTGFGKNVTCFADQLAVTAQKSNTNIEQLGEAILAVGGTARNLAGGTKLRNVILAMTPETKKAKEAFEELKIASYDANGNLRPLEQTFGDINVAMRGIRSKKSADTRFGDKPPLWLP